MPQPVPAVPVFPAGYAPVGADITAWITNPFSFLSATTLFRGQLQASKTLTAATQTLAQLDTIIEDPYSGWSATLTASQPAYSWLCPAGCSGWYEITMTSLTTSPGTNTDQVQANLYLNGSEYATAAAGWGVNGTTSGASGAVQVPLLGGIDYLQFYIYSTAGTSTPATAGQYPSMEIAWIST